MISIKRPLLLLIIPVFVFGKSYAQSEVHLSVSLLPNHHYKQKVDQNLRMEMKFKESKEKSKKTGDASLQTPTTNTISTHSESETVTGKLTNDTLFPLKMTIVKSTTADGQSAIPAGTMIYGNASTNGTTVFDSIVADGMDAKTKKKMFAMFNSIMSQVTVPDHILKVGEKFTHQIPLSMPMAGVKLNMVINTTYKLKSISNGNAYFDITQVYTIIGETGSAIKIKGTGKGNMVYEIKNRYYTAYALNGQLDMDMSMDGASMSMKMAIDSYQNVVITAN